MAVLNWWAGIAIIAAASAVSCWGCFSPRQPGCAFSCATDGLCPSGYSCEPDGLCHRDDGTGVCDLPAQNDAGTDTPADAGND